MNLKSDSESAALSDTQEQRISFQTKKNLEF